MEVFNARTWFGKVYGQPWKLDLDFDATRGSGYGEGQLLELCSKLPLNDIGNANRLHLRSSDIMRRRRGFWEVLDVDEDGNEEWLVSDAKVTKLAMETVLWIHQEQFVECGEWCNSEGEPVPGPRFCEDQCAKIRDWGLESGNLPRIDAMLEIYSRWRDTTEYVLG